MLSDSPFQNELNNKFRSNKKTNFYFYFFNKVISLHYFKDNDDSIQKLSGWELT